MPKNTQDLTKDREIEALQEEIRKTIQKIDESKIKKTRKSEEHDQ